jgi:hypothetical protein
MKMSFIYKLFALGFAASASVAMAAFTPITNVTYTTISGPPDQYILTSITANGNTVLANGLYYGTTSVSGGTPPSSIARMDDCDINNLATGFSTGNLPIRTVMFGGVPFTNVNGSLPDFFIFEAAGVGTGNPDDITVAAIFLDDSLGQAVTCPVTVSTPPGTVPGWGNTGLLIWPPAASSSQVLAGLCWDITDLMDASSNNLPSNAAIKGVAIAGAPGIDPCAFLATVPAPPAANITVSVSGGNLTLNWPAGQGWRLQARTNSLTVGTWQPVPGAVPPFPMPIDPANATVFYRLVWP